MFVLRIKQSLEIPKLLLWCFRFPARIILNQFHVPDHFSSFSGSSAAHCPHYPRRLPAHFPIIFPRKRFIHSADQLTLSVVFFHSGPFEDVFYSHCITLRCTTPHHTTLNYTTLHYPTPHCITLHYVTLHYISLRSLHHHKWNFNYTTLITLHHNYNSTTLHYTTTTTTAALHHTTSSSCGWGDRPGDHCNHCSHSKKHSSNHLSVHQWIRSAICDSQQPISPVGFLFLKLPPPPCAALLVII